MRKIDPIYSEIAKKMIPPGSPRYPRLFQLIANLEQARVLKELPDTAENIAKKLSLSKAKVEKHLKYLFERGLVTPGKTGWNMVTMYGLLKDRIGSANPKYDDNEVFDLAREISLEENKSYALRLKKGEKIPPVRQGMRVVPRWRTIKDIPGVLPIEDMREIFKNASPIVVHRCPCRVCYRERPCLDEKPVEVCFAINATGQRFIDRKSAKQLTYDEFLNLLDELEEHNLINLTGNSNRMPEVMCSCCTDCCGIFVKSTYTKPLLDQLPYAKSRFVVEDNTKLCSGCGACVERCPVNAITIKELKSGKKRSVTDFGECIGCGLCVLTCKQEVRKMKLVRPPEHIPDFVMGLDTEGSPIAQTTPPNKK
jgi:NAD-dependent dihydropyrimidine dehydrogenase PreA subunit/DNA-binding transcriptional ArsR family regulator